MSVIIRLQNLPWSANALDIRQFFHGLSIPEGGVHIVGGELGDAFIAFSTDEDARQAFSRNNGKIKEVQISLMLSSRTEMQKVIEAARAQSYAAFMQGPSVPNLPLPAIVPPIIPAAVPDFKKDSKDQDNKTEKRDRKRSRSRSRDRKDRRDKRYKDRSRSRSRDRRDRRRRERSRSRARSRSKDRDRKTRDRRRSDEYSSSQRDSKKSNDAWSNQNSNDEVPSAPQPPMLSNFSVNLDDSRRNQTIPNALSRNGFVSNFNRGRETWPVSNVQNDNSQNSFPSRMDSSFNNLGRQGGNQNFSFQNRRFPRNNTYSQDEQYDTESDHPEREVMPNCCIKIQPFYGGYGEIRRFFQRAFISNVGIKLINDEYGHRTGIAYVQFGHVQGKQEALLKNGELLNGVNVEVSHLDDEEFDESVDRFKPDNYSQDSDDSRSQSKFKSKNISKYFQKFDGDNDIKIFSALTVEDLPTYVKEQDILKMFSSFPLTSIILTTRMRGGHIAYVKFGSADDAKKALEEISNHVVEGKPVTVKPCLDTEFEMISQQHDVDIDRKPSPLLDTDCVSITRLPAQTNDIEITDFFSDIGVRPVKIHLMSNRLGFTGQAFCEFKNKEDAAKALKKDSGSFGPNHVSVQAFPRVEMEHILHQSALSNVTIPPQIPIMHRPHFMNPMGQNRPFFTPRNNFDGMPRRGGHRFMGPGGFRPRFMNGGTTTDDAPPGCTVFMDNVPYKAGTMEILEFFDGYDITNNVSRRYNPNNTPSAEAKVVFNSPEEAYRAVQERSGKKIWDRPIYLQQV